MAKNTREALLQKGFDFFHEKGYHATGIGEITDALNVSKGSFYNHFKKKEKFAEELIDTYGNQFATEHREALSKEGLKPLVRIINFYEKKIEGVIRQKYLKGCMISNMCQEVADNSEIIARSVDTAFEGMKSALSSCLKEAQDEGSIAANRDIDMLAEFILNSWNGALMRVKASRNSKALNAFMDYLNSVGD